MAGRGRGANGAVDGAGAEARSARLGVEARTVQRLDGADATALPKKNRSLPDHLAQMNVARFHLPVADPANADFMNELARVNAVADRSPGFVWRLVGEGDNATDLRVDGDPGLVVNMSVGDGVPGDRPFLGSER